MKDTVKWAQSPSFLSDARFHPEVLATGRRTLCGQHNHGDNDSNVD